MGLIFLVVGAVLMYVFLSLQQRSWHSFSAAAGDWFQSQGLTDSPEVTAICGGDSLPWGYVESDLGDMSEERARQLFRDAAIEFGLDEQAGQPEESAGVGRWKGFKVEGYLSRSEGEGGYVLGLSFDPYLCLSA